MDVLTILTKKTIFLLLFKFFKTIPKLIFRDKTVVDGGWTEWTSYGSYCHSSCRNTRNRTCDNPTTMFGGQKCSSDSETAESTDLCFGDECCPDTSDYIGCFRKQGGLELEPQYVSSGVDPCYCIGYCASKGYSLTGVMPK